MAPTQAMIDAALTILKAELESPEFQAAFASLEDVHDGMAERIGTDLDTLVEYVEGEGL